MPHLATIALLASALASHLCSPMVNAAPISTIEPPLAELLRGVASQFKSRPVTGLQTAVAGTPIDAPSPHTEKRDPAHPADASDWRDAELLLGYYPIVVMASGLFDSREFELSISDDTDKMYSVFRTCVYPDSYLRNLGGVEDDCDVVKPYSYSTSVLSLPFLAISCWTLVILTVAGLYHFYGVWRVRRWLRRIRASGGAASAIPRRLPERRPGRSSSRRVPRSRTDKLYHTISL